MPPDPHTEGPEVPRAPVSPNTAGSPQAPPNNNIPHGFPVAPVSPYPNGPITQAGSSKAKQVIITTLSVVLAIFAVGVIRVVVENAVGGSDPINRVGNIFEDDSPKPYISSEHGFTVDFPGFPTTEHTSFEVDGSTVPYTQYVTEIDRGSKAYLVQVAVYPTPDFDLAGQERGALDGALNGMAQELDATVVSSSNDDTFLGYPSASATLSVTIDGDNYTMYALNFIKDNSLYTIVTTGETQSKFDAFVASFGFN